MLSDARKAGRSPRGSSPAKIHVGVNPALQCYGRTPAPAEFPVPVETALLCRSGGEEADFCPRLCLGVGLRADVGVPGCAWLCPCAMPVLVVGRCRAAGGCRLGRMFRGRTAWDRNHLKATGRHFWK